MHPWIVGVGIPLNDDKQLLAQDSMAATAISPHARALVTCVRQWDQLRPLAADWNALARGNPLMTWEWLGTWWTHYCQNGLHNGRRTELFVLCVFRESGELLGLAPWFIEHRPLAGRILRFLGSGEVCTDYLTLLTQPGDEYLVAEAVAHWLMDPMSRDANFWTGSRDLGWDQMEWDCVLADDPALCRLREQMHFRGAVDYTNPEQSVWRVALPATWQEYCKLLSKPYRRKIRRLQENYLDTGRAVIKLAENSEQFDYAWKILSDLHQQRRNSLGERGCFASPAFESFHQDAARQLLQNDMLRLFWLELDGKPVAIEYALQGPDSLMVYQSGMDPACLEHQPGNIMTVALLQWQLTRNGGFLDFMRGDEPYKARWRAQPQATQQVRILPGKARDRARLAWWRTRELAKAWVKKNLRRAKTPHASPQTSESE